MADLFHIFGNDLQTSASGDLLLAFDGDETDQRIYRRLLTNPGSYLWEPTYGAGLGSFVGQIINVPAIQAVVLQQMKQEAAVVQSPAPVVTVNSDSSGFCRVTIGYINAITGNSVQLAVPVS